MQRGRQRLEGRMGKVPRSGTPSNFARPKAALRCISAECAKLLSRVVSAPRGGPAALLLFRVSLAAFSAGAAPRQCRRGRLGRLLRLLGFAIAAYLALGHRNPIHCVDSMPGGIGAGYALLVAPGEISLRRFSPPKRRVAQGGLARQRKSTTLGDRNGVCLEPVLRYCARSRVLFAIVDRADGGSSGAQCPAGHWRSNMFAI
ncbi:MAG: hypothetical protein JWN73_4885 [Betaproteobacteria bacterium]|nr:hypothetical protein [Betaproteobacteria bacterium]